jgi:hypothetical protein
MWCSYYVCVAEFGSRYESLGSIADEELDLLLFSALEGQGNDGQHREDTDAHEGAQE